MESSTSVPQLVRVSVWVGGGWFTHALRWWGWGQAHCWVLKDQPSWPPVQLRLVTGGWVVGLLFLSSLVSPVCPGVWGLVGLLFEICIVDASIFTARP